MLYGGGGGGVGKSEIVLLGGNHARYANSELEPVYLKRSPREIYPNACVKPFAIWKDTTDALDTAVSIPH